MDDVLKIPIDYKGEELEFEAKLIPYGYIHRLVVEIEGIEVHFEPDEERQYRAILSDSALEKNLVPDVHLIKKISEVLNNLEK
ncbi:MAG TPA: hypothetical protein VGB63_16100 [Pedobacter sp.]|jgi:hypothetical protein